MPTWWLSNDWLNWAWNNYSILIIGIPSIVTFILKAVAIWNPNIPSDKIRDLFANWKKPSP